MGAQQSTVGAKPASLQTPAIAPGATANGESKPKPCCVCKEEKQKRDECMLLSTAQDPQLDCVSLVDQYKKCMAGFGY